MSQSYTDPLEIVARERRRDRIVRRVSVVAWAATVVTVLIFGSIVVLRMIHVAQLVAVGAVRYEALWHSAVPLIAVLGVLSLIVAVLATVAMFLRLRTATLVEIQLRLAALEAMLAEDGGRRE
jgi:hypothetical protein